MNRFRIVAALLGAMVLTSCEKNAVQDITGTFPNARIKFFNFGVSAPAVNFYANDTKMTAVVSGTGVESNNGVAYAAAGAGGFYTAIEPGQYTLTGRIAAATDKDLPIATVATTIEDGKFYSFYMSGIYNTTAKTVEAFVVEDPVVEPTDHGVASVRFVHAISNANPMILYARNTVTNDTVAVGGEVAYKAAGSVATLPSGVYDLFTRYPNETTNRTVRTGLAFAGGRMYTVTARGSMTVTTGITSPGLDQTANR